MAETGLGKGSEKRRLNIERLAVKLDAEQDPKKLAGEIKRIEIGDKSWLTGAPEVKAAVERGKHRLQTM